MKKILLTGLLLLVLVLLGLLVLPKKATPPITKPATLPTLAKRTTDIASVPSVPAIKIPLKRTVMVQAGDNLAKIFSRLKISQTTLVHLRQTKLGKKYLARLHPGTTLTFSFTKKNQFQEMEFPLSPFKSLSFKKNPQGKIHVIEIREPITTVDKRADITIKHSLFSDSLKNNVPIAITQQLTDLYAWVVDFSRDIQPGDKFKILYETHTKDGKLISTGNIIAAEFEHKGKTIPVIKFTYPNGKTAYYTPSGKSIDKAFLRYPVAFTRISSRFHRSRKHPILGRWRSHKGVDFAAKTGTPIRASGSGRVTFIGRKGGYGKTIILKHGNKYSTLYAHLSRYGKNIRRGKFINQGQLIGYVGSTGLATGPHLHYEFRIHGRHYDPLKVKLPQASSLPAKYKSQFAEIVKNNLGKLNHG